MNTSNPTLGTKTFENLERSESTMTAQGAVNKTGILFILLLIGAVFTWNTFVKSGAQAVMPLVMIGLIGGFVVSLITIFAKKAAFIFAPIYAILEGVALGGISALIQSTMKEQIVIQAVILTFGVLFLMLFLYKTGMIKVTGAFMQGVMAATGAICLIYLVTFVLSFFNIQIPYIHGSGIVGIGFSIFVVVLAAFNLVLDFHFITEGENAGAPKYMEWYLAFGLMVTLVWLYLEILRLLMKLNNRR